MQILRRYLVPANQIAGFVIFMQIHFILCLHAGIRIHKHVYAATHAPHHQKNIESEADPTMPQMRTQWERVS